LLVAVLLPAVVAVVVAEATTSLAGGTTALDRATESPAPAETSLESLMSTGRDGRGGTP